MAYVDWRIEVPPMAFNWRRGHAHFALLHLTSNGPLR
jgi:hypothetical protein